MNRTFKLGAIALLLGLVPSGCEFFVQTVAPTPTLITAPPIQAQRPMVDVKNGRLEEAIRMTGRVEADRRMDLFFKAPGRIKNVKVRQGDEVVKGDILAELETGGLESQVADGRKTLETSKLRLTAAEASAADEAALAEQTLLLAEIDVSAKRKALADVQKGPTAAQLAAGEAAVAAAGAALKDRQTEIWELSGKSSQTAADAAASIVILERKLEDAKKAASDLRAKGAPTEAHALAQAESEVTNLEADIESQRAKILASQKELEELKNKPTAEDRAKADNALQKARLTREEIFKNRLLLDEAKAKADLDYQEALRAYDQALKPATEEELTNATAAIATAKAKLLDLEVKLNDTLLTDSRADAVRRLAEEIKKRYADSVAAADRAVTDAEAALAKARRDVQFQSGTVAPGAMQKAGNAVEAAEANLAKAQASLQELKQGADAGDVEAARNGLKATEIKRDSAKRKVEDIKAGKAASAIDLTILRNTVEQAQIKLDRMLEQQFENQVIAPFSGEVTYVRGRPGDQMAAYQEIIGLADPSLLVVEAVVPEVDQAKLAVGQSVNITIDQFAGVVFPGRVDSLPRTLVSNTGQAVRIPETKITVDWGRPGLELGMLARLKIVIQVKESVLKVPISAVREVNRREFVETVIGGQRRSVPVKTGIRSDTEIEILDGLAEGTTIFATP